MRGSVNKNITKPLHEVLLRQNSLQVSQYPNRSHNEFSRTYFHEQSSKMENNFLETKKYSSIHRLRMEQLDRISNVATGRDEEKRFLSKNTDRSYRLNFRNRENVTKTSNTNHSYLHHDDLFNRIKRDYYTKNSFLPIESDRRRDSFNYRNARFSQEKNTIEVSKDYMRSILNGIPKPEKCKHYHSPPAYTYGCSNFSDINKRIRTTNLLDLPLDSKLKCRNESGSSYISTVKDPRVKFGVSVKESTVYINKTSNKERDTNFSLQQSQKQDSNTLNKTTDNLDKSNQPPRLNVSLPSRSMNEPTSKIESRLDDKLGVNKKWDRNSDLRLINSMNYNLTNSEGKPHVKAYDKKEDKFVDENQERNVDTRFPGINHSALITALNLDKKQFPTINESSYNNQDSNSLNKEEKIKFNSESKKELQNNMKLSSLYSESPRNASLPENKALGLTIGGRTTTPSADKKGMAILLSQNKRIEVEKPVERKKDLRSIIKENSSPWESHSDKINSEKIATMLREHKMLLEILLEKVNIRMHDINPRRLQIQEELADSGSLKDSIKDETYELLKKLWKSNLDSQEKLKRLCPSYQVNKKTIHSKKEVNSGMPPSYNIMPSFEEERQFGKRDVPLTGDQFGARSDNSSKIHSLITMQTSPSRVRYFRKTPPDLDGSKLAMYNYSPLKQILNQYNVSRVKPKYKNQLLIQPLNNKGPLGGFQDMKGPVKTTEYAGDQNMSYSSYLKNKQKTEKLKERLYSPAKDLACQIKKLSFIYNKKKSYSKDNVKKKYSNITNILQTNKPSTARKMLKIKRNTLKHKEKEKKHGSINTLLVKTKEGKVKKLNLSKGIYFSSNRNDLRRMSYKFLTLRPNLSFIQPLKHETVGYHSQPKSIRSAFNILSPPNKLKSFHTGFENSEKNWISQHSNHIIQGPSWSNEPTEYSSIKTQWNLPFFKEKIYTPPKPIQQKVPEREQNARQVIEYLTSLSQKIPLSNVISSSSKPTLSKMFDLPLVKSSILPLPTSIFKLGTKRSDETKTELLTSSNLNNKGSIDFIKRELSTCPCDTNGESPAVEVKQVGSNNGRDVVSGQTKKEKMVPTFDQLKYKSAEPLRIQDNSESMCKLHVRSTINDSFDHKIPKNDKDISNARTEDETFNNNFVPYQKYPEQAQKALKTNLLKGSWSRVKNSVTNLLKPETCCAPNFDEMIIMITKEMENNNKTSSKLSDSKAQQNYLNNQREKRVRELAMISSRSENPDFKLSRSQDKNKVSIPKFLEEGPKNY